MSPLRRVNFYFAPLTGEDARRLAANAWRVALGGSCLSDTVWRQRCEADLQTAFGSAAAYAFPSARSALWATLKAIGIGPGDEVLVTGFTCVAVPAPVVYLGATPVYVDVDPRTFNMDVARIEERLTPRTRAIVVQHTFGNPVAMEPVLAVARRRGLNVIEDCCLALGSRYRGRPVGVWGDAGIVSFELSKLVTAGWGGVVWANDPNVGARLGEIYSGTRVMPRFEAARCSAQVALSVLLYHPNFNLVGRFVSAALYRLGVFRVSTSREETRGRMPRGYLDQLSDAHWRIVLRQLAAVESGASGRQALAHAYRHVLDDHGVATYPQSPAGASPNWIRFPFLIADRRDMQRFFRRRGIEVGQWFDHPVSGAAEPTRFGYRSGDCPEAEYLAAHVVNLPLHGRLSERDAARVAQTLDAYLRRHPENTDFARRWLERRASAAGVAVGNGVE